MIVSGVISSWSYTSGQQKKTWREGILTMTGDGVCLTEELSRAVCFDKVLASVEGFTVPGAPLQALLALKNEHRKQGRSRKSKF